MRVELLVLVLLVWLKEYCDFSGGGPDRLPLGYEVLTDQSLVQAMARFGARARFRQRGRCLVRFLGLGPSPVLPAVFCGGTVRAGWRRSRLGDSGVGEIVQESSGLLPGSLLPGCALVLGGSVLVFLGFW